MFIKRGWYYLFPIFLCGITFHLLVPRKTHPERIQPILLQASNKAINTKQLKFHWRYKMESCLLYECELGWKYTRQKSKDWYLMGFCLSKVLDAFPNLCAMTQKLYILQWLLKNYWFCGFPKLYNRKNYLMLCHPTDILMQFLIKTEKFLIKGKGQTVTAVAHW